MRLLIPLNVHPKAQEIPSPQQFEFYFSLFFKFPPLSLLKSQGIAVPGVLLPTDFEC